MKILKTIKEKWLGFSTKKYLRKVDLFLPLTSEAFIIEVAEFQFLKERESFAMVFYTLEAAAMIYDRITSFEEAKKFLVLKEDLFK